MIISGMIFAIFLIVYLDDLDVSGLEVSDISEVGFGERVMIFGKINSTEQVAIKGSYEGESSRWIWFPTNFIVEDKNGSIWIDNSYFWTARTSRIRDGPHENDQYWNGDEICVIGTVFNNTAMGKSISSEYIGQNPDDFQGFPVSIVYLFGFSTAGLVLFYFLTGTSLLERKHLHIKNFDDFSPKHILKEKPKPKKQFWKTTKTKWSEFNYSTSMKTGFAVLFIFFGLIVFLVVLLMSVIGKSSAQVNWGEICFCSTAITVVITLFFTLILAFGFKENIGEFTIKYEGDKNKFGFTKMEEKIMDVIFDFGFPYKKDKKVISSGSWRVKLDIPRECGNLMFRYTEIMDRFILDIKLGKGVKEDNDYKRKLRYALEEALDDHLGLEENRNKGLEEDK